MKKIIIKITGLFILVLSVAILNSCSVKVTDEANNVGNNSGDNMRIFSRENTKNICSNAGFGKGIEDDAYVALDYIYSSNKLSEKYGDLFEVTDFGGTAEWGFRLGEIYKATGRYIATIEGDEWIVKISKGHFGKWVVTECYQETK